MEKTLKKINPEDLIPMEMFAGELPVRIELAYARDDNHLFGERIYRKDASLWLHKDLAAIVLLASMLCYARTQYRFVLYDGLRTVDAQEAMLKTKRVRDNPNWLEEPRLLSPPGAGGHPRGMAVDIVLENEDGKLVEMGTVFDHLAEDPHPEHNPAHRRYGALFPKVRENREILCGTMMDAAKMLETPLLPLPEEWWDFRIPKETSAQYQPLYDADLPPQIQMMESAQDSALSDFSFDHFLDLKQDILITITPHLLAALRH